MAANNNYMDKCFLHFLISVSFQRIFDMSLKTLMIRYTVFLFTVLAASISSVILIKLMINSFSLRNYRSTLKLNFLTNFTAIYPEECLKTIPFISGENNCWD